jgi:hypothetical protein
VRLPDYLIKCGEEQISKFCNNILTLKRNTNRAKLISENRNMQEEEKEEGDEDNGPLRVL